MSKSVTSYWCNQICDEIWLSLITGHQSEQYFNCIITIMGAMRSNLHFLKNWYIIWWQDNFVKTFGNYSKATKYSYFDFFPTSSTKNFHSNLNLLTTQWRWPCNCWTCCWRVVLAFCACWREAVNCWSSWQISFSLPGLSWVTECDRVSYIRWNIVYYMTL